MQQLCFLKVSETEKGIKMLVVYYYIKKTPRFSVENLERFFSLGFTIMFVTCNFVLCEHTIHPCSCQMAQLSTKCFQQDNHLKAS